MGMQHVQKGYKQLAMRHPGVPSMAQVKTFTCQYQQRPAQWATAQMTCSQVQMLKAKPMIYSATHYPMCRLAECWGLPWLQCGWIMMVLIAWMGRWCRRRKVLMDKDESRRQSVARRSCRLASLCWRDAQNSQQFGQARAEAHRLKRRGDGNCFWRAIAGSQWKRAKRSLKEAVRLQQIDMTESEVQQLMRTLQRNQWASNITVQAAAAWLDIEIVVYGKHNGAQQWTPVVRVGKAQQPHRRVAVTLAAQHYDRLRGGWEYKRKDTKDGRRGAPARGPESMAAPSPAMASPTTAAQKSYERTCRKSEKTASRCNQRRSCRGLQEHPKAPTRCTSKGGDDDDGMHG